MGLHERVGEPLRPPGQEGGIGEVRARRSPSPPRPWAGRRWRPAPPPARRRRPPASRRRRARARPRHAPPAPAPRAPRSARDPPARPRPARSRHRPAAGSSGRPRAAPPKLACISAASVRARARAAGRSGQSPRSGCRSASVSAMARVSQNAIAAARLLDPERRHRARPAELLFQHPHDLRRIEPPRAAPSPGCRTWRRRASRAATSSSRRGRRSRERRPWGTSAAALPTRALPRSSPRPRPTNFREPAPSPAPESAPPPVGCRKAATVLTKSLGIPRFHGTPG